MDELDRRLGVDRRLRVGNAGHAREAAGDGRPGAALDRLILLPARLTEVDVHVDQAGGDDEPGGVDRLVGPADRLGAVISDRDDQPVADEQVVDPVDALRGIDHATATNQKRAHQTNLPSAGNAAVSPAPSALGPQVSQRTPIRTARPLVT